MAASNVTFNEEEISIQNVVDLFSTEIKALKNNLTILNETITERRGSISEQDLLQRTNVQTLNMEMSTPPRTSFQSPNFDLVSILHNFSGDNDDTISDFISKVRELGEISGWNESNKVVIAKLKLTGTAHNFSKSDDACRQAKTLDELQTALENRFRDNLPDHYYFEQLANIRQEKGERIENFADRVKQLSCKTFKPTQNNEVDHILRKQNDRQAMEAFTRGLFGELGRQVRIKFPKSFQEAVTLAIAMRDVERRPNEEVKSRFVDKGVFSMQAQSTPQRYHYRPPNIHSSTTNLLPRHPRYPFRPEFNNFHLAPTHYQNSAPRPMLRQNFTNQGASVPFSTYATAPIKQCSFCKRLGHWELDCRTKQRQFQTPQFQLENNVPSSQVPTNSQGRPAPASGTSRYNHQ